MKKGIFFIILLLNCFAIFGQKVKRYEYEMRVVYDFKEEKSILSLDSIHSKPGQFLIQAKYINEVPAASANIIIESKNNYSTVFTTDSNGMLELSLEDGCYFLAFDFEGEKKQVCIGKNGLIINLLLSRNSIFIEDDYCTIISKVRLSKRELKEIKECLQSGDNSEDCIKKFKILISYQI